MGHNRYGRDVHAEMEALMACARIGVSPCRGTLYCSIFPYHNCVKHIVAAGVSKVVCIEPYPKSRALELFKDSIAVSKDNSGKMLVCVPFLGVGPRRYIDLFSLTLRDGYAVKRKSDGMRAVWSRSAATPRVPLLPGTYLDSYPYGSFPR